MLFKEKLPINQIQAGTKLKIFGRNNFQMSGVFVEAKTYNLFYIDSTDVRNIEVETNSLKLDFEFSHNGFDFEFTAKITDFPNYDDGGNLVEFKTSSPVRRVNRRKDARIVYSTDVTAKSNDVLVFEGVSNDISQGGIGIWSDNELKAEIGDAFTLEFYVNTQFKLNAKLVRSGENKKGGNYPFEHSFAFAENDLETRERFFEEISSIKVK
ncbi:MAG: PilZ domain-containing protein [Defluviitaleaceae bacterium]|nr:PilZ domain-containing protein [Defluviitaleaceae bacterium]